MIARAAVLLVFAALAGRTAAQPAPPPLTILDVPFISQSEALCGGAAAAMVLRYWGERGLAAESFAHLVDRSAAGIRTDALVTELRARGWSATGIAGGEEAVANELGRGRPVMALIEDRPGTFHYVVLVAATPGAYVFHDPARAPMRVMARDEFDRRWRAADRWMAVIVPGTPAATPPAGLPAAPPANAATSCEAMVAEGVARAQAGDLAAAERTLTAALACPGGAAFRELAGLRLLERRWADVESLAGAAVAADPGDAHSWRLLGTSRFVQDDAAGALDAWNRVGEPRVDLIGVAGLARTRQRVVERLLGVPPGALLTAPLLGRARRSLEMLPSAASTRLEFVPVPSGLAELRAVVNERPVIPTGVWPWAVLGGVAAARREVELTLGSVSGGGERIAASWRFWPGRPRVGVNAEAPAPWGGTWGVHAFAERQGFDVATLAPAERTRASLEIARWIAPAVRVAASAGADRWRSLGAHGTAGGSVLVRSAGERLEAEVSGDAWWGTARFASVAASAGARSSPARTGAVLAARAGVGGVTAAAPLDLWLAGDTGDTRAVLLRAHPLVDDGRIRVDRLGRRLAHASVEARYWRPVSLARVGAAVFADAAHTASAPRAGGRGDVDVGAGVRLAVPGLAGTFRGDVARGLRDGTTTFSFVYDPSGW